MCGMQIANTPQTIAVGRCRSFFVPFASACYCSWFVSSQNWVHFFVLKIQKKKLVLLKLKCARLHSSLPWKFSINFNKHTRYTKYRSIGMIASKRTESWCVSYTGFIAWQFHSKLWKLSLRLNDSDVKLEMRKGENNDRWDANESTELCRNARIERRVKCVFFCQYRFWCQTHQI